jgi:hypothetical protein
MTPRYRKWLLALYIENAPASAFPVACCGVSERTTIKWINTLHFEDSLQLAAGSFKYEWLDFHIEQGRNRFDYMSPHWLLDRPTGAFFCNPDISSRHGVTATADMSVLPGVLGCRTLRRTVQVRLGSNPAVPRDELPGGTTISTVSRQQLMKHPGY